MKHFKCNKVFLMVVMSVLLLTSCGFQKADEDFKDLTETEYIESSNTSQMSSKAETELLAIMKSKIGCEVENYIYVDMDHDGANELIATYCKEGYYQTWYCSSDGKLCELVHENDAFMEYAEIEVLDLGTETHVALNAYMSMGNNKNHSIIALKDKKIVSLIFNEYGSVYMTDKKDIVLSVEAYDGLYDPNIDGLIVHTWKNTYLFFDGSVYKEYGAIEISEEEYLEFQNAETIKEKIAEEMRESNTISLEYEYFKRSNGIMHIQCNVHRDSGEIQYGYYTVRYSDNILEDEIGEYNQGQMETNFSNLEVVY